MEGRRERPRLVFAMSSRLRAPGLAAVFGAVLLSVFLTAPCPRARAAAGGSQPDSLVLLHTNDTHARLMPFEADDGSKAGGAAARAALIEKQRGHPGQTLLLDGGDVFQGTPYFNFFRGVPDYRAMSLMRYNAGVLGNHDLDDGPAAWLRARAHAEFEILSANVCAAAESSGTKPGDDVPAKAPLRYLTRPFVIRDLGAGRTVALFGLTTAELTHIVAVAPNAGVAVADPVSIAGRLVPE